MKEEDYVMKLMATYGALRPIEEGVTQRSVSQPNGECRNFTFLYTEPFFNHFKFRNKVDDHNNLRQSPISLEESISTKDWQVRVFMLVLELFKVNARLVAITFFTTSHAMRQLEFRRKLAKELIDYSFSINRGERIKRKRDSGLSESICSLETAPPFAGTWTGTKWEFLTSRYPQHVYKTVGCQKRIRTYCRCMIGHWMCSTCIGIHIASRVDSS
jgi:hypothetical protein